jgi:hypothetical protein
MKVQPVLVRVNRRVNEQKVRFPARLGEKGTWGSTFKKGPALLFSPETEHAIGKSPLHSPSRVCPAKPHVRHLPKLFLSTITKLLVVIIRIE